MASFKHSKGLSFLAEQVGAAAEDLATRVLDEIGRDSLEGREEIITPQIARELTAHLLDELRTRINEREIDGVTFRVHCFKHSEEKQLGADIAGIVAITRGGQT